jgi:hypothetical protein
VGGNSRSNRGIARGLQMHDVIFILLTLAIFAVLGLIVRGVERM